MTTPRPFQTGYELHLPVGFHGDVAIPGDRPQYRTFAAGEELEPGQGVIYDASDNDVRKPSSVVERLAVIGVVAYERAAIGDDGTAELTIKSGTRVKVGVEGTFWVKVGEAVEYGDILVYNQTDDEWEKKPAETTTNLAALLPTRLLFPNVVVIGASANGTAGVRFSEFAVR